MFVEFDINHRMAPLRKLYLVPLTYFLRSNISNANISEMVRASSNMLEAAFIDFDICQISLLCHPLLLAGVICVRRRSKYCWYQDIEHSSQLERSWSRNL